MILCLCRGVSHRAIDDAIHRGARTVRAVARETGAGTVCGSCACDLRERLQDEGSVEGRRSEGTGRAVAGGALPRGGVTRLGAGGG